MTGGSALVLVRMGGRACAIPCGHIVEVVPRVTLTELPDAPACVLGMINLRGRVVPVVDIRARLAGKPEGSELPSYQHLVIVQVGARAIGVAVDEVDEVRSVPPESVEKPGDLAGGGGPGVVRIARELVLVIGPEEVLHAIG